MELVISITETGVHFHYGNYLSLSHRHTHNTYTNIGGGATSSSPWCHGLRTKKLYASVTVPLIHKSGVSDTSSVLILKLDDSHFFHLIAIF